MLVTGDIRFMRIFAELPREGAPDDSGVSVGELCQCLATRVQFLLRPVWIIDGIRKLSQMGMFEPLSGNRAVMWSSRPSSWSWSTSRTNSLGLGLVCVSGTWHNVLYFWLLWYRWIPPRTWSASTWAATDSVRTCGRLVLSTIRSSGYTHLLHLDPASSLSSPGSDTGTISVSNACTGSPVWPAVCFIFRKK